MALLKSGGKGNKHYDTTTITETSQNHAVFSDVSGDINNVALNNRGGDVSLSLTDHGAVSKSIGLAGDVVHLNSDLARDLSSNVIGFADRVTESFAQTTGSALNSAFGIAREQSRTEGENVSLQLFKIVAVVSVAGFALWSATRIYGKKGK